MDTEFDEWNVLPDEGVQLAGPFTKADRAADLIFHVVKDRLTFKVS